MSKHNWTFGGIGLAAVLLAAVALSACSEFVETRKGPPHVIGVLVADVNFNEFPPTNDLTCIPPYPEPDPNAIPPGQCGGITSLCNPVNCYPPRTGPAFGPTYTGGLSLSYPCSPAVVPPDPRCTGGVYTTSVPANDVYNLTGVLSTLFAGAYQFAQIRVQFNVLMDGPSIQPNPTTCAAPPGSPGLNITTNGVADNANWIVCYQPNSPTPAWGASLNLTPNALTLAAATTYHVTGPVRDQDGNTLNLDVTVVTQ